MQQPNYFIARNIEESFRTEEANEWFPRVFPLASKDVKSETYTELIMNKFMASLTGHHWITHGLADCIVFVGLGLIFLNTSAAAKINPNRLVSILIWAVVLASVGLFAWFLLF